MQTARKIDPSEMAKDAIWTKGKFREVRLQDTFLLVGYMADPPGRFSAFGDEYESIHSGSRWYQGKSCWIVTSIEALMLMESGMLIPVEQGEDNAASD